MTDIGIPCDLVFFDFKKAFDSVSHTKLINKLRVLNFSSHSIAWVSSYLHNRRQRVSLRGQTSEWASVTSGVPQGSVLGPLLFNIFLSDLPKKITSFNRSYADDLKLLSPSFLHLILQKDIKAVSDWADENSLVLNHDKCIVMHFGHNNPCYQYFIQDKILNTSNAHTDLGIMVDSTLKFHQHADFIVSKVFKKAHFILKCFSRLCPSSFTLLYTTFLRPVLEYCSQIARPSYSSFVTRLESCQRRLTKWCKPIKHLTYQERLKRLNLPSVEQRLLRGDLILTYQILHKLLTVDISDFFCLKSTITRGHRYQLAGEVAVVMFDTAFFRSGWLSHGTLFQLMSSQLRLLILSRPG